MSNKPILNVYHPKLTAGLWLVGMLVICILGSQALTKDWLETGFLALLPTSEQQPEIAKATRQHNQLLEPESGLAGGRGDIRGSHCSCAKA